MILCLTHSACVFSRHEQTTRVSKQHLLLFLQLLELLALFGHGGSFVVHKCILNSGLQRGAEGRASMRGVRYSVFGTRTS